MTLTNQPNTITRREVYGYDDQSRLISVSAPEGVIHYAYDPSTLQQGNAVVSDYQYDPLNRLTDLTHFVDSDGNAVKDAAEAVVANFHYVLNPDGNKASATETDDQNRTRTFTWKYDALDRLTSEVMESSVDADYITRFTMDLVGNRLKQETDNDATAQAISAFNPTLPSSLTPDEVIDYSYDANDRLQWERNDAAGTAEDTYTTYAWNAGDQTGKTVREGLDASGNVTEQTTFAYNVRGRTGSITIVKGGQTTVITYRYNPDGIRVEESTTAGGTTTTKTYLIDSNNLTGYAQVLEEFVNGALAKTFTLGHDVVTQHDAANGPLTLIYDGHGSTRELLQTAANGDITVLQRYAYEAYGKMLDGHGLTTLASALTALLYSGEMTDKLTGLQNLRDRLYDVNTGRFTQFDRYVGKKFDPASLHKYLYTHAAPINGIDPSGRMSVETVVTVGLGLLTLVALTKAFIWNKFETPERRAAVGSGGPDITDHIIMARSYLMSRLRESDAPDPQGAVTTGYRAFFPGAQELAWENWDLIELPLWGQPAMGREGERGSLYDGSDWYRTVTVRGQVYRPEEVNYYLYGAWFAAMGKPQASGEFKIMLYRIGQWDSTGIPGRIAWFRAGYFGDLDYARTAAISGATPGGTYNGVLRMQLGYTGPNLLHAIVSPYGVIEGETGNVGGVATDHDTYGDFNL